MKDNNTIIGLENCLAQKLLKVCIQDIYWERVFLHIKAYVLNPEQLPLEFYMVSEQLVANARLEAKECDGLYDMTVNVTNPGFCRCLQEGRYSVYACSRNKIFAKAEADMGVAARIGSSSRFITYGGGKSGFCVLCGLEEYDEALFPCITVFRACRSKYDSYNERNKCNAFFVMLDRMLRKVRSRSLRTKRKLFSLMYHFWRKYHSIERFILKANKSILFMSERNEKESLNLFAVEGKLQERNLNKVFVIRHSFRMVVERRYGIRGRLVLARDLGLSDIIFVDDHCPTFDWFHLDGDVELVQLWHAGAGYKGVGYSRWGALSGPSVFSCHRQYSYAISPSKNIAFFFSEQFGINEEQVLPTGMPRMDDYLDPSRRKEKVEELYVRYPLLKDKKVILFAPTYRGCNEAEAYYPFEKIDFPALHDFCAKNYVVLFKMHPWVREKVPLEASWTDCFLDVGDYPDINDLFYITDLLITDYSSAVFEYAVQKKPALFYAFDELPYSYTRGFHRDYRSSTPGKICHTFSELLDALKSKDFEFEKMEEYLKYHFDTLDGHASDRVIDWMLLGKVPEEYRLAAEKRREDNKRLLNLRFDSLRTVRELPNLI